MSNIFLANSPDKIWKEAQHFIRNRCRSMSHLQCFVSVDVRSNFAGKKSNPSFVTKIQHGRSSLGTRLLLKAILKQNSGTNRKPTANSRKGNPVEMCLFCEKSDILFLATLSRLHIHFMQIQPWKVSQLCNFSQGKNWSHILGHFTKLKTSSWI